MRAAQVFQTAREYFRGGRRASIHEHGDWAAESLGTRIDEKVERSSAHIHSAEALARLVHQPARHSHSHSPDSSRVAAQVDNQAVATRALLDGIAEFLHDMDQIQKN